MMEEKMRNIYQTVIMLPYFNYEVPLLYEKDGNRYIPVIALCEMLELHANLYIPQWRKLVLWTNARKLPLRTTNGRKRVVWCLHIGAIPLWCNCFDWLLISPTRQKQLQQATEAWYEVLKQAHIEILSNYKQMSNLLFKFLTIYEDTDAKFSQLAIRLHPISDHFDLCIQLEGLISQGKNLIREATDYARQMVQEQATNPITNAVRIEESSQTREQLFLPLIPVFSLESCTKFFEYISQISQWHQSFFTFLERYYVMLKSFEKSGVEDNVMSRSNLQYYLDLRRDDIDLEMFGAALAVKHISMLITSGGSEFGRSGCDYPLHPLDLQKFLARAVETAQLIRRFEQEWHSLYRLVPNIKIAWEKGQIHFQNDLVRAKSSPEEMDYLSLIDFAVDCYAYVSAMNTYPDNYMLQAWFINGYMVTWRQHFLPEK